MNQKIDNEIVIPGEIISEDEKYLPGEGTEKVGKNIISNRYGICEESNNLIRVIPLSGVYQPRKGNVVIGKVENITFYGWVIDIDSAENSFLPIQEVPKYINKGELEGVFSIDDIVVAKILDVNSRGIDLTVKGRGLGKIENGIIIKINPSIVPRIIGREGSMINLIKEKSDCNITVGQNGLIWINGKKIENELLVKKAIEVISENSASHGLTDEINKWFDENKITKNE